MKTKGKLLVNTLHIYIYIKVTTRKFLELIYFAEIRNISKTNMKF